MNSNAGNSMNRLIFKLGPENKNLASQKLGKMKCFKVEASSAFRFIPIFTFLIAITSSDSSLLTSTAWYTTPKEPLPMIFVSVYFISVKCD